MRPSHLLATVAFTVLSGLGHADPASDLQKGEYMARAANCAACHTAPYGKRSPGGCR